MLKFTAAAGLRLIAEFVTFVGMLAMIWAWVFILSTM